MQFPKLLLPRTSCSAILFLLLPWNTCLRANIAVTIRDLGPTAWLELSSVISCCRERALPWIAELYPSLKLQTEVYALDFVRWSIETKLQRFDDLLDIRRNLQLPFVILCPCMTVLPRIEEVR